MLRQISILFIFFAFTFSTIDELVQLCFDKIESVQQLVDLEDSEPDNTEKDVDLDTIFQENIPFHFQEFFFLLKLFFIPKHPHNYCKKVIHAIIIPPPEV